MPPHSPSPSAHAAGRVLPPDRIDHGGTVASGSSGGRIRTCDLRVMSPTSYQNDHQHDHRARSGSRLHLLIVQ